MKLTIVIVVFLVPSMNAMHQRGRFLSAVLYRPRMAENYVDYDIHEYGDYEGEDHDEYGEYIENRLGHSPSHRSSFRSAFAGCVGHFGSCYWNPTSTQPRPECCPGNHCTFGRCLADDPPPGPPKPPCKKHAEDCNAIGECCKFLYCDTATLFPRPDSQKFCRLIGPGNKPG